MQYKIVPVTPFEQNATLFWCEKTKKAVVVDPGGDIPRLKAALEAEGLTLEKILVTHGHIDHVGAVADLAELMGVPIEGPHEADRFWIDGLAMQSRQFGFPQSRSFEPDRWLNDGDTVTFGEVTLEVLHCPGHTPGHVVFFHRPSQLMQVGDVIFQGSIGRTDFPRGDHQTLIDSIKRKLFALGDEVAFVPGHGPMSTVGEERQYNPFLSGRFG